MNEFKRNMELLEYYVDKYNETKNDEFVIATFLKIKALLNYGQNIVYGNRDDESKKLFLESKDTIAKGVNLIKSKVGSVYKYSNELLDIFIDTACNLKLIEDDTCSAMCIRTTVNGLLVITNTLAGVILEPLDKLKMLNDELYPIEPHSEILRYLSNLNYMFCLDDENARTYPDRVINKLKEFTYRYTASIIEDVKDDEAIKAVLLDKHRYVNDEFSIFDLMVTKGEYMDKDYNVIKRVKDDNLNELREILTEYVEYNNKVWEISKQYMDIMKNFPNALSEEFYLDASGSDYNELLDLWPNSIAFANIEALEKMKDILDKSIAVYNVYYDILKGYNK